MTAPTDRLHSKFRVQRMDGRDRPGGDKANAQYFVLDYAHDPYARKALAAYADVCEGELPGLAADLRAQLDEHGGDKPAPQATGQVVTITQWSFRGTPLERDTLRIEPGVAVAVSTWESPGAVNPVRTIEVMLSGGGDGPAEG